jgi:hypothetical protein
MTFAQRRNRLTTHFSEHIPVVKATHICNNQVFLCHGTQRHGVLAYLLTMTNHTNIINSELGKNRSSWCLFQQYFRNMKQLLSTNTFLLLLNKTAENIFNFTYCRRVKYRQLYLTTKPLFVTHIVHTKKKNYMFKTIC